jgi:hypothetical protein
VDVFDLAGTGVTIQSLTSDHDMAGHTLSACCKCLCNTDFDFLGIRQ